MIRCNFWSYQVDVGDDDNEDKDWDNDDDVGGADAAFRSSSSKDFVNVSIDDISINTEYADRYKQQLDISVQYVEQLLSGTFNQLPPTEIRFSHCADLAHYNELLSQTANTFIHYDTTH